MSHEHTEYSAPVPDLSAAQLAEPGAVTIVVPTFNESANIRQLLHRITESVPSRLPCEVVFVDDSTDDTPEVIRDAARDCPFPVTVLHREEPVGGLGGAVVEGMRTAGFDWIVVMDGDCQHPPSLVPELVATGERSNAALVVASRYIKGGSRAGLAGSYRVAVSRGATWLTKSLFPRKLHGISDPMSGFFAIRRSAVTADVLKPLGYKILLELAVRSRPRAVGEVPFVFEERFAERVQVERAGGLPLPAPPGRPAHRVTGRPHGRLRADRRDRVPAQPAGTVGPHRRRSALCAGRDPRQPVRRRLELRPHRASAVP